MKKSGNPPAEAVDAFLRQEKQYNESHGILPSENRVIDRLLQVDFDMRPVYEELLVKLPQAEQWRQVIGVLLSSAAFWNPDKAREDRAAVETLRDINADIAKKAQELARLLDRRSQLGNKHSLRPSEDYHPLDWIGRAAASTSDRETGYRFESYVKPELERARCEFDLKYWPTLADVLMAAAHFAAEAQIAPTDPLTEAALSSRKDSAHVFVRAFLAGLRDSNRLPADFKLSIALSPPLPIAP